MKTYYSSELGRRVTIPDNLVLPRSACPSCGERDEDHLIWEDDEDVRCATCGVIYNPSARPVA